MPKLIKDIYSLPGCPGCEESVEYSTSGSSNKIYILYQGVQGVKNLWSILHLAARTRPAQYSHLNQVCIQLRLSFFSFFSFFLLIFVNKCGNFIVSRNISLNLENSKISKIAGFLIKILLRITR